MKNLFKKMMLFAAAAMAFASCENDGINDVNTLPGIDVTINATTTEARSVFGELNGTTYPTLWEGTEEWAVCLNDKKVEAKEIEFSNGNTAASATVTFNEPEAYNGKYTLFAVSPLARFVSVSMASDYIRFRVPGSQTPSATSCDPVAQVLIAQSEASETVSGFDVAFKHATAYGKFSFVNVAEGGTVTGVTIKSADVALAGRYVYAPSTKTISFKDEDVYEINLTTNTTTDLWFACGPAQVQGKKLTFIINTDKGDLEKEVTMPGNFVAGKVATFKIDMAGIDYPQVEGEQWQLVTNTADITAGEYLIAAKSLSGNVIYLPSTTTSSAPAQKVINISGLDLNSTAVFTTVQIPDDARFTFSGSASAMTITNADGNYLYLYNNNNGLRVGTTNGSWTIATNPNNSNALTFSMTATKTRYISVYKDQDWRSYDSIKPDAHDSNGASGSVFLYKKVAGGSEGGDTPSTPAPELTITTTAPIEVGAEGDVATVAYTITNPVKGKSVTASADQTWVNGFDYTVAGEVSFAVDANTGAAREATVTLTYDGATPQTIKISQEAASTGGGDEPSTGGTFVETFANYKASLSSSANSYGCSGSFAGVSENGITWSYTGCGNPGQTNTDVTTLKGKGLTYDTAVTMGKGGTLSATIPGGATSVSFYILTSGKATCTVTIKGASGSTLKTQTVAKSTTGKVEITGINSNGGDITISFKEASTQNRVTVAGLVYTR